MTTNGQVPATEFPRSIGQPATRALALAGITRFEQLAGTKSAELLTLHGVGPKAVRILAQELAGRGLSFADEAP